MPNKRCKHKKQPKVKRVTPEEKENILAKLQAANLEDKEVELIKGLMHGNERLCDQLEKGLLTYGVVLVYLIHYAGFTN